MFNPSTLLTIALCLGVAGNSLIASANKGEASPFKLQVKGNDRTDTDYIKTLYWECLEDHNKKEVSKLEQCLFNSELFSKVSIQNKKKETLIQVQERWTLLPIPYARSDNDTMEFGAFLYEQNLFGRGKFFLLGGTLGNRTHMFFFDVS